MKNKTAGIRVNGGILYTTLKEALPQKSGPDFSPGDTVKVYFHIREGNKERIQAYEGIVTSMRGEGLGSTFTVRRVSHEVGVERIFPYYSPSIQKIEVVRRGRVRRARLFYLRDKSGKEGRVKEIFHSTKRSLKKSKDTKSNSLGPVSDMSPPHGVDGENVKPDEADAGPPISDPTEATKPEATKPEATKPEATKPEATKPEATKPEATEPEAAKPEAAKPEATKPEVTETEVTETEAAPSR